jgi:hypothetical protein
MTQWRPVYVCLSTRAAKRDAGSTDCLLAAGAPVRALDPFEFDVVRETEDTPDHLGRAKAERVAPQLGQEKLPPHSISACPAASANSACG